MWWSRRIPYPTHWSNVRVHHGRSMTGKMFAPDWDESRLLRSSSQYPRLRFRERPWPASRVSAKSRLGGIAFKTYVVLTNCFTCKIQIEPIPVPLILARTAPPSRFRRVPMRMTWSWRAMYYLMKLLGGCSRRWITMTLKDEPWV